MKREEVKRLLDNRTMTSFGVSIGTGLMLEALFKPTTDRYDPDRPLPEKVDLTRYDGWVFNIYTLIRNILGSLSTRVELTPLVIEEVLKTVREEIYSIKTLFLSSSSKDDYFKLLIPKYDILVKKFNKNKNINIGYINKNLQAINLFKNHLKQIKLDNFIVEPTTGYKIESRLVKNHLITTHYILDLLHSNNISILESHTGVIKDSHMWYTKYPPVGKEDLSNLPMLDILIYILGDGHLVRGFNYKTKSMVLEIANKKRWSYLTTRLKVVNDLRAIKDLDINIPLY